MKRKILACLSVSSLLVSAAMCVTFSLNQKEYEVEAYTAVTSSKMPTTINLNDLSTSEIQAYYSPLNALDKTQRAGNNLLKSLKPILKNGQLYYSYESSNGEIWKAYEITDRDWVKSPATAISGYDAVTNTITGYTYGTSASNPGTNPYIHALYVNRDVDNKVRAWAKSSGVSSHGGNNEWCIDREHIWPKSAGFENSGQGGARGDLMHLWAGDSYVNSALHNNYYYGYVDKTKPFTDGKDKYSYDSGNYMGTSLTLGEAITDPGGENIVVFEPQDSDKGDIARALFYMVARYNYLSGSDSDGIDSNNPNLELVSTLTTYSPSGYMSSTTKTGKLGILEDLLEWNRLDPPDEWEIHRNNLLYNNYTKNRNPFIDYPKWADIIWGSEAGYANPNKDDGIDGKEVDDVILSLTEMDVDTDSTNKISATVPTGIEVTWEIEDNTIASLDKTITTSGEEVTITPLKTGDTVINASATINSVLIKKSCTLHVVAPVHITGISLSETSKSLKIGDSAQLTVNFTPSDATNKNVTWSSSNSSVATVDSTGKVTAVSEGGTEITVTTEDGGFTATCLVTVTVVHVSGVSLSETAKTIKVGEDFKLTATVSPNDAANKNVSWSTSDSSVVTVDQTGKVTAIKEGQATITVTTEDGNKTASCTVTVEAKFKLSMPIIIAIAVGGAVVLVVFIIILAKSKKARKVVAKAAKKQVKKATKKSSSSKKKK